jgi:hypothetical protein
MTPLDENQFGESDFEKRQQLADRLAEELMNEIEKECIEKGYTAEIIDSWKDDHFRTPYK